MQEKTLGALCHKVYALTGEGIIALNANVVAAFSLRLGFFNLFLGRCLLNNFFLNNFFLVHFSSSTVDSCSGISCSALPTAPAKSIPVFKKFCGIIGLLLSEVSVCDCGFSAEGWEPSGFCDLFLWPPLFDSEP